MKKIVSFFKDKKNIILCSFIIFICQFIIISNVGIHGDDDYEACTYYNKSLMTLSQKVEQVINRATEWNCRLGEIIYFIVGDFPSFVFWIIDAILMVVLVNLIVYYAIGKEKYKKKKYVGLLSILVYVLTICIFPDIFFNLFWMGSIFNHLLTVILLLFIAIPYRDQMDGYEIKFKSSLNFTIYLILCFIFAFGSEAIVVTFISGMFISNVIYIIKNKRINLYQVMPVIMLILGFTILYILSLHRISVSLGGEWGKLTKNNMFYNLITNRIALFGTLICSTIIYLIIVRGSEKKEFLKRVIILGISTISILAMVCVAYYVERAILIFDFAITILIVYEIYEILKKIESKYVNFFVVIILIGMTTYLTYSYCLFFKDYNAFKKLRDKYIYEHINDEMIILPKYDNKVLIKFIYNFYVSVMWPIDDLDIGFVNNISNSSYIVDCNNEYNIKLR